MERIYIINLRKEWIKVSGRKRGKKAMKAIKEFIKRHTKSLNVWIDPKVNEKIFEKNKPPAKIKVKVEFDKNLAKVYLAP